MINVLIINLPSSDWTINRDMAGGLGFSAGVGIILPPLDLLNMVTTLKAKYKVYFIDAVAEKISDKNYFIKFIDKNSIQILIGNLSLPTLKEDIEFYRYLIKRKPNLKIVVKTGIKYQIILNKFKKLTGIELLINNECDLDIDKYLNNDKSEKDFIIKDLNKLPIPDRSITKTNLYKYSLLPGIVTTMQTSRGCPFPCSYYCPYPLVQGKKWRAMGVQRIIKEIIEIKKLGINNIFFRDATFTFDKNRTRNICKQLINNKIKIKWWCETRINVLDENLLGFMKKAGCLGINVGVETMNSELILKEGKPGVSVNDVINIRKLAKKIGIKLHFLMIVGLPDENVEGLYKSFKYLIKLKPESVGITSITPYPGTNLFKDAKRDKLITSFNWNNFDGTNSNMKTKYLTSNEIEFGRKLLIVSTIFSKKNNIFGRIGLLLTDMIFILWKLIKKF